MRGAMHLGGGGLHGCHSLGGMEDSWRDCCWKVEKRGRGSHREDSTAGSEVLQRD